MKREFKKGEQVTVSVHAAGVVTNDGIPKTILKVDESGVWLDNGNGNDPSGPYNRYTGVKDFGGFLGKQIIGHYTVDRTCPRTGEPL